jgi:putative ABC transport system ATP-binding protein
MALTTRARLLLADEVTGELDRATTAEVLDAIDLVRGESSMTLVAATHDPAVAMRADRLVEIADGRIRGTKPTLVPT